MNSTGTAGLSCPKEPIGEVQGNLKELKNRLDRSSELLSDIEASLGVSPCVSDEACCPSFSSNAPLGSKIAERNRDIGELNERLSVLLRVIEETLGDEKLI